MQHHSLQEASPASLCTPSVTVLGVHRAAAPFLQSPGAAFSPGIPASVCTGSPASLLRASLLGSFSQKSAPKRAVSSADVITDFVGSAGKQAPWKPRLKIELWLSPALPGSAEHPPAEALSENSPDSSGCCWSCRRDVGVREGVDGLEPSPGSPAGKHARQPSAEPAITCPRLLGQMIRFMGCHKSRRKLAQIRQNCRFPRMSLSSLSSGAGGDPGGAGERAQAHSPRQGTRGSPSTVSVLGNTALLGGARR